MVQGALNTIGLAAICLGLLAGTHSSVAANSDLPALKSLPPTTDQSAVARRGFLYAGGEYVGEGKSRVMRGQAYVEVLVPKKPSQPYPLVMIHGGASTATTFMQTPDGRPGWADFFVGKGYVVYLVDQPARGRSPYFPALDGETFTISPAAVDHSIVAPERYGEYPQAKLHTQWPDHDARSGTEGEAVFDTLYAAVSPSVKSQDETERLGKKAVDALLDRIGPSILLTHSQSGPIGWTIADGRPNLVKAIVAIEPSGPPFMNLGNGTTPANRSRVYGLTNIAVTYDPPVKDATELLSVEQSTADGPDLVKCVLQQEPARRLANLQKVPVLMISSEASYHSPYDHCTAKYLKQAGVPIDFVKLADRGIHGNDHVMMLEKNNLQIAGLLHDWISRTVRQ